MLVHVPVGAEPGAVLMVPLPDGRQFQVQVPPGVGPGDTFRVPVPAGDCITREEDAAATRGA